MTSPAPAVILCAVNLRLGGQLSGISALADALQDLKCNVRLALPEGVEDTKPSLDAFTARSFLFRAAATWRMLRKVATNRDDILHLVVPSPSFGWIALLAGATRRGIVISCEGLPLTWDRHNFRLLLEDPLLMLPRFLLSNWLLGRLLGLRRRPHIVVSEEHACQLRWHGFRDVTVVRNLMRWSSSDSEPLAPELLKLLEPGAVLLAYVGHAHPVKGLDDLVEAFARAHPRRPELRLVLALSRDAPSSRIRRRISRFPLSVRERVQLTGLVPVGTLLQSIDALVLPYRSLTTTTLYPSLLLEADAVGCPVVISRIPFLEDILQPGSPHLHLFPARDVEALAAILEQLPRRPTTPCGPEDRVLRIPNRAGQLQTLIHVYQRLWRVGK